MHDNSSGVASVMRSDDSRLAGTIYEPRRAAAMRVAVVGLGALGNELVKLLGLVGVGDVLLIDPDRVGPENSTRCVFFRSPEALGQPKAEVLVDSCSRWFPGTHWQGIAAEIADVGWRRLQGRDVIFAGVDRDSARVELSRISTRLHLPVCDGGLNTADYSAGRVTWFPGAGGACFCCRLSGRRRREILSSWQSQAHPCRMDVETGGWSSTPTLASITAALQVELGMRWLLRKETGAINVDIRLDEGPRLEAFNVPQSAECPFHDVVRWDTECNGTFAEILAIGQAVQWEWPICLKARCQGCGIEFAPLVRSVKLRREGHCPSCGSTKLLELESVREVPSGNALAKKRPEEIGLPADHLYSIREERMGLKSI